MKNRTFISLSILSAGALAAVISGCGKSSSSSGGAGASIALVTPPVTAATPTGLKSSSFTALERAQRSIKPMSLASDFKSRFFSGTGPTQVLTQILPSLDSLITSINTQSATNNSACLSQTPVSYTITPFGQTVTMYAQCYNSGTGSYSGDPGFTQFGIQNGVTYIYSANGAEWVAAIVTPVTGATGKYSIQAWIGLGYANTSGCSTTWDGCSYGSMELQANSSTGSIELAVAGMGFGYCGAQLKSDGTNIYVQASADMGTTCNAVTTLCVSAADASTASTCAAPLTTFALPAMGRESTPSTSTVVTGTWGSSAYPAAGANMLFNGTASDAIHFGPTTPTSGAVSITVSSSTH